MPRLILFRHAKSAWDNAALSDFDRPLSERGRHAAPIMGRYMAEHHLQPYQILCSSSRRTRETLAAVLPYFDGEADIRITRELYDSGDLNYTSVIRKNATDAKRLMVIGHNPATQDTALSLIGSGNPELISEIDAKFPTAALAVIDFDASSWSAIKAGSGRIVSFVRPRDLQE